MAEMSYTTSFDAGTILRMPRPLPLATAFHRMEDVSEGIIRNFESLGKPVKVRVDRNYGATLRPSPYALTSEIQLGYDDQFDTPSDIVAGDIVFSDLKADSLLRDMGVSRMVPLSRLQRQMFECRDDPDFQSAQAIRNRFEYAGVASIVQASNITGADRANRLNPNELILTTYGTTEDARDIFSHVLHDDKLRSDILNPNAPVFYNWLVLEQRAVPGQLLTDSKIAREEDKWAMEDVKSGDAVRVQSGRSTFKRRFNEMAQIRGTKIYRSETYFTWSPRLTSSPEAPRSATSGSGSLQSVSAPLNIGKTIRWGAPSRTDYIERYLYDVTNPVLPKDDLERFELAVNV